MKLSKLSNSSARYQNPHDMRFIMQLYFNNDILPYVNYILIENKNYFIYVNITYVYVTEFTLADPT